MADFFLSAEDLAYFVDAISQWLAYGIGFGAVMWVLGSVVALIFQLVRY